MRTIDTYALSIFAEVAQRGGITAAADALGIAKSAVSKQLAGLEAALKVRLFERSSRRVALTKEGEALLPRARSILADIDQLIDDAGAEKTQTGGTVRIAASHEFGAFLAEHFLPELLNQHPQLKVLMRLEYDMDDLHDPAIDLAFRLGSISDDRLVARHIGDFVRVFVCSPQFAAANRVTEPQDLSRLHALLFSDRDLDTKWVLRHETNATSDTIVNVEGRMSIKGFNALFGAAKAGLGVASLPSFVANPDLAKGTIVPILPGWQTPPTPIFIAYRPNVMRIGRVRTVIDAALAHMPDLLLPLA